VHVVLEEWQGNEAQRQENTYRLILLSARTQSALERMARALADYLNQNPAIDLGDVAHTLQQGRKAFEYRWMALCSSVEETMDALKSWKNAEIHHCLADENDAPPMNIENTGDKETLLAIGKLWLRGQTIDWKGLYPGETPSRASLPTYPFEKEPYWIDGNLFDIEHLVQKHRDSQVNQSSSPAQWQGSTLVPPPADRRRPLRVLVFASQSPMIQQLIGQLRGTGPGNRHCTVITVIPGQAYRRTGDNEFTVAPGSSSDYRALLAELKQTGRYPDLILHTWNIMEDMETGLNSLRRLSEAIEEQGAANAIDIDVITAGAREVTGEETLMPHASHFSETLEVILRQGPAFNYRTIDIELPMEGSAREQALAAGLMHQCLAGFDKRETVIAYRGRTRFTLTGKR
jgi:acyl transferase domain-containing protein